MNTNVKGAERNLKELQLTQQIHDESYHSDVVGMDLLKRVKHMTLHYAKYTGYFLEALEAANGGRFDFVLVDAFVIALATANALGHDLGEEFRNSGAAADLKALGDALSKSGMSSSNPSEFISGFAKQTGKMAKACESWDHMEKLPFQDLLKNANLALLKLILAEAAGRQMHIENLYQNRIADVEARSRRAPEQVRARS